MYIYIYTHMYVFQVVAFSSENNVMECGEISCDVAGVRRLLDFLSHSFEGGACVCLCE